jgi:hypothetical protein
MLELELRLPIDKEENNGNLILSIEMRGNIFMNKLERDFNLQAQYLYFQII